VKSKKVRKEARMDKLYWAYSNMKEALMGRLYWAYWILAVLLVFASLILHEAGDEKRQQQTSQEEAQNAISQ